MLNPRILVVFTGVDNADALLDMALEALANAGSPYSLRFAAPLRLQPAISSAELPPGALRLDDLKFYEDGEGLEGALRTVTDETHVLALEGEYVFREKWERVLLSRWNRISVKDALMTALIGGEGQTAQAYLPAFGPKPEGDAVCLGRGLALVCSAAPVRTLIVHPGFWFGRIETVRRIHPDPQTLSIAAFAAGIGVFALDRTPLWPAAGEPTEAWLAMPGPEILPPTVLARFEQFAGLSLANWTVTVRATQGLFNVEDGYPQRLPFRLTLRQVQQAAFRRAQSVAPLAVTAFIDLPDALHPQPSYLLRFSYLMGLKHLPLTLYAGGEAERYLRSRFPNSLSYPERSLLPRSTLSEGMSPMQFFLRNKLPLLQRALRSYPTFSHIAWVDIDTLPYPVCPQAALDFAPLMDQRVHIGWVADEPDTSLMVVPSRCLKLLVREVQAVTQFDVAMKRSFSERALMRRLMEKFPDLFTLHPLPEKGLLFLTAVDPALLSAPHRQALCDLQPPLPAPPAASAQKERKPYA
ncbi:MAG TPA: hypothetical protein PLP25_03370 [Candidatus Limiplasma sp.]|nr:hypothetical protein [Candidatus Limiplasma sp.]HPS80887.1 hypothetical protein [Candidatus Limiplasma sp.]